MLFMTGLISTVHQLADAFGGTGALASWADVEPSAVSNWKAHGSIPSGHHLRIYLYAKQRGWKLSPSLFGLERFEIDTRRRGEHVAAAE
jgi:hypothetical protein